MTAERLQVVVEAETSKAIKDLKKLDKSVGANTKSADKFGKLLKGGAIAGGLVLIGAAIAGVVKVGSALIGAFAEQEQAEARLNATLLATGGIAGVTASEMFNLATELQGVTKFGDEAIIAAESLLLTFKSIGKDVMPDTVEAVLNVAEAMGTDLQSSAIQLGKALNDPTVGLTALQRVGITFSESQKETIKAMQATGDIAGAQTIILAELESQFGGVARAAADTATGSFTQFSNAIGDTKELAGEYIATALSPMVQGFTDLVSRINESIAAQRTLNKEIQSVKDGTANLDTEIRVAENTMASLREEFDETSAALAEYTAEEKAFFGVNEAGLKDVERRIAAQTFVIGNLQRQKLEEDAVAAALAEELRIQDELVAKEAERVIAAAAAAAERKRLAEEEVERKKELAIQDLANYQQFLDDKEAATKQAFDDEFALLVGQKERELEIEQEAFDKRQDLAEQSLAILTKNVGLIGEAFATGEDASKAFAKAGILAVADVIDALAQIAIVEAAIAFGTGNIPKAAALAAAGVGAGIAAGAVRANAAKFQSGTGPEGFQVPQGFENDNFPVSASSGETVRVDRPGEGGGSNGTVILEIDGRILGQIIGDLSDAGRVRINPRSVKGL